MSSIILLGADNPTDVGCFVFHRRTSFVVHAELPRKDEAMTSKERKLWEQAIRVLKQNSVTVRDPAAKQAPAAAAAAAAEAPKKRAA
jgi:hypothetical protein